MSKQTAGWITLNQNYCEIVQLYMNLRNNRKLYDRSFSV